VYNLSKVIFGNTKNLKVCNLFSLTSYIIPLIKISKKIIRNKEGLTSRKAVKGEKYNNVKPLQKQRSQQNDISFKLDITKG